MHPSSLRPGGPVYDSTGAGGNLAALSVAHNPAVDDLFALPEVRDFQEMPGGMGDPGEKSS
jgi:hypothetical protein